MDKKLHQPKPKADLPPPRKPPGQTTIAGLGGDDDKPMKKYETVRIALSAEADKEMITANPVAQRRRRDIFLASPPN